MQEKTLLTLEGHLDAKGLKVALIVSRFNNLITDKLLAGAIDALERHGAEAKDLVVIRVPGSWEIPSVLRDVLESGKFDAVVCLGAVIRGGTPHFEYVATEVAKGIAQLSLKYETPVGFGVLTCDTLEQALERAGSKLGNKGAEAALAVIEVADLKNRLKTQL